MDLIDRQAVIRGIVQTAAKKELDVEAIAEVINALEHAPSAQPECTQKCMPMYADVSDTISRQAAIDLLDNLIGMVDDNHDSDYDSALRMGIEALKAEEPVRMKGKWVKLYAGNYKCSECGDWWEADSVDMIANFKFCPNCGADMRGREDE